ncbi:hypothetical protein [Paraburkholderia fungorum]
MEKCKFGVGSTVGPVRWFRLVQRGVARDKESAGCRTASRVFWIQAVCVLDVLGVLGVPGVQAASRATSAARCRATEVSSALACFRGNA